MTKTSQDDNLNDINFSKHFCEYHTEKLKCRVITCLILKVLPWWICYYCSHIQSFVELESVFVATAPYFEHISPLTPRCLIKGEALISREGWRIFSFITWKTIGRGGEFSVYCMKNKGRVSKFLKLSKRVYLFIRHLRVLIFFEEYVVPNKSIVSWLLFFHFFFIFFSIKNMISKFGE